MSFGKSGKRGHGTLRKESLLILNTTPNTDDQFFAHIRFNLPLTGCKRDDEVCLAITCSCAPGWGSSLVASQTGQTRCFPAVVPDYGAWRLLRGHTTWDPLDNICYPLDIFLKVLFVPSGRKGARGLLAPISSGEDPSSAVCPSGPQAPQVAASPCTHIDECSCFLSIWNDLHSNTVPVTTRHA